MNLRHRFSYHKPKPGQPEKYQVIRSEALNLALTMEEFCPDTRELSLAFTKLEEAVMWANASIARYGS
jgi:hypothetical protein